VPECREGIELHLVIVLAGVQRIEIGDAINPKKVFLGKTRSIRRLSFHTKAYQPCVLQVLGIIYSLRCTR
jgi:hypothetical protein